MRSQICQEADEIIGTAENFGILANYKIVSPRIWSRNILLWNTILNISITYFVIIFASYFRLCNFIILEKPEIYRNSNNLELPDTLGSPIWFRAKFLTRSQLTRSNPNQFYPIQSDATRPDPVRSDPTRLDSTRHDSNRPDPTRTNIFGFSHISNNILNIIYDTYFVIIVASCSILYNFIILENPEILESPDNLQLRDTFETRPDLSQESGSRHFRVLVHL